MRAGKACALVGLSAAAALAPASAAAQAEVSEEEARQDEQRTRRTAESMARMPDERARSRFRIGRTLYEEGRFREAAGEFSEAYRLSERPALLFNVYLAYRDAGLLEKAADALRRFLAEAEEVEARESLETRLAAMEETIAEQKAEEKERAREAAEHAEEQTEQRERARAEERIKEAVEKQRRRSVLPWAVGGTGIVMLAAGTVTGVIALREVDDLEKQCPMRECNPSFPLDTERARARRFVRATDALLFGGLAVLGTGVLLFVLLGPEDSEERAPQAGAACGPRGCGAEVRVSF